MHINLCVYTRPQVFPFCVNIYVCVKLGLSSALVSRTLTPYRMDHSDSVPGWLVPPPPLETVGPGLVRSTEALGPRGDRGPAGGRAGFCEAAPGPRGPEGLGAGLRGGRVRLAPAGWMEPSPSGSVRVLLCGSGVRGPLTRLPPARRPQGRSRLPRVSPSGISEVSRWV